MRLLNGNFHDAAETILNIGQNIYDEFWNLVNEADLIRYITLSLFVSFRRPLLAQIGMNAQLLAYKLFEDYTHSLDLLENYSKCRYEIITSEFEKIQLEIAKDPFLANNYIKINFDVKNNILKEILTASSVVSISYLSKVLKEKDTNKIENWILNFISEGVIKVKIDDIDKIVYATKQNSLDELLKKGSDFSNKTYHSSLMKIFNNLSTKNIEVKEEDFNDACKKYSYEKIGRGVGVGRTHDDEDLFYY